MCNKKKIDAVSDVLEADTSSAASMMKKEPEEVKVLGLVPKG